jgi:tetratricopeptide (TPR) repeat protein
VARGLALFVLPSGIAPAHHALAREAFLLAWARKPEIAVSAKPLELAREDVEQSLRRSPRAWRLLGRALAASGAMKESISAMEEACSLAPDRKDLSQELAALRARAAPDLPTYGSIDAALDEAEILLAKGSAWRYALGVETPSPGLEWAGKSFDDGKWKEGRAPLGFGASLEESAGQGGGTIIEGMLGRSASLYARVSFAVPEPGRFRRIVLRVDADDGAVAHVNGREAGRVNAGEPGKPLGHEATAAERKYEAEKLVVELSRDLIEPGANLLALQGLAFAREGGTFLLGATIAGEPNDVALEERLAAFRHLASGEDAPARVAFFEGRLHERAGRHHEAEAAFRRVLALDRSREEPFLRLLDSLKKSQGAAAAYSLIREEIAKGALPHGLQARPPDTPGPVQPPAGEKVATPGVVLEATPFFSFGQKDTHVRTHWQVRAEGADYDRDPTVRFLSASSLERLEIPAGLLLPGTTYRWRAAYLARGSALQAFGAESSFSTGDFPFRAVSFDLVGLFNRDVIAGPGEKMKDSFDGGAYAFMAEGFDGERANDVVLRPLPPDRRIGVHVLGEYSGPNALQVSSRDTQPLRIATVPGRYALVRFLLAGGEGWSRIPVALEYTDGTRDEAQLACVDWCRGIDPFQPYAWEVSPIRGSMHRVDVSRNALAEAQAGAALFEQAVQARADKDLAAIILRPDAATFESRSATVFNLLAVTGIHLHAEK